MDIVRIIGIGFITTVLTILIKQHRPELAFGLPVLGAAGIFLCIAPYLRTILSMFEDIAGQVGIESQYIKMVIKIIGVAYICQFSAELCKDVGEGSMASKIEFAGKIMILTLSMPVIYKLLGVVSAIINY